MNIVLSHAQGPWMSAVALALVILGMANVWRGLLGGQERARGLLLREIGMLERMEGFRLTVFGLVLLGIGAAMLWQLEWLFYLALGIGFVEILESSTLIAVWRWGRRRQEKPRSEEPWATSRGTASVPGPR
jgi:hypothetical protein